MRLFRLLLTATVLTAALGVATPSSPAMGATGDPVKIMPLGASITWGEGSSTTSGYRAELWRRLVNDAGLAVDFVGSQQSGSLPDRDNEGHSGWRIDQIASSIEGWLTTYRPEVVLMHLGTNDMAQDFDVARAPDRMGALLDRIAAHSPSTTILVSSLVPSTTQVITDRINAFNARLPGVVKARADLGKKVRYVDLNPTVTPADLADFLHPNDAGYAKMASVWYSALEPVLAAGRDWPLFTSGLDADEPAATWLDTNQANANVGGFCCGLAGMQTAPRAETARGGSTALMYSGNDTSTSQSYSYNRVFDVHLLVASSTVLTYWVYPLQRNATFLAVDVALTDGGNLRDSGAVDQFGVRAHPQFQGEGGRLVPNQWNLVRVNLGGLAGRTIDRIHLGYDQPAETGLFRGYVDDIRFVNSTDPNAAVGALDNLALKRPATGSAPCTAAETAERANDGTTGGNSKWCSGVAGATWQVDLGAIRTVDRVVVRHAAAGSEEATWNTRGFHIQTSSDGAGWVTRSTVTGNINGVTSTAFPPVQARHVRLVIDAATQTADNVTRIYEVEVFGAS